MLADFNEAQALANLETIIARSPRKRVARPDFRRWYVLCVEPRTEGVVTSHLIAMETPFCSPDIPVDVPVHSRNVLTGIRYISGRKRVLRKMMPGYVLAHMDLENEWPRVRSRPGVTRVLEGPEGPKVVDQVWIKAMLAKEAELLHPKAKIGPQLKIGQQMQVIQGPFAGWIGEIERLDDNERIRLLLDLFGRKTPLDVAAHEIEAI